MNNTILQSMIDRYVTEQKMSEHSKDYGWLRRAISTPFRTQNNESVKTEVYESDGIHYVVPSVRMRGGKLVDLRSIGLDPYEISKLYGDAMPFKSATQANNFSMELSDYQGSRPQIGQFAPQSFKSGEEK